MQIGNRVDCSYGVPYQKNRRELQDTRFPQMKNAHSVQEEEKFEENAIDSREVRKPWLSMGNRVREQLVEQASSMEEDSSREECMELIQKKIAEMQEKIDSGEDVNESFQIGAKSFTVEEWDKLLEEFDSVQEVIRELMKERQEQLEKQQLKKEMLEENQTVAEMLFSESTSWDTKKTEIKVSNFKEYETENYKFVPEPTIGKGGMRILKNGQSVAVFSVDDLKIRVDEKTGTRVLISEMAGIDGAWYDAIPVDEELERGLAEAIGVNEITEVKLEGYYIGTHAGTGIQYVMRPGDEGKGGKVLLRNEADVAKYNALADEYFNRYSNLVSTQEYGRIYASLEICGIMERTATGIVKIGFDNISYNDNYDYKKNWSAMITEDTWNLLHEWLKENRSHMEKINEFSTWQEIIDELGGYYERIWSDEELEQGYLNN